MPESVDWPPDPSQDPRTQIPDVLRHGPPRPAPAEPAPPSVGKQISEAGTAWGVAFNFVATIIAGALLGWGFDWWRSTGPWGLLGGLVLGFVVALLQIIRYSLRQDRDAAARRKSH
jgi:F0F1-type ATP synthase assembly protein I